MVNGNPEQPSDFSVILDESAELDLDPDMVLPSKRPVYRTPECPHCAFRHEPLYTPCKIRA